MILTSYAAFREVFGEPDNSTTTTITAGVEQPCDLATASDIEAGDYVMVDFGTADYEIVTVLETTTTTRFSARFENAHSGTTPLRILSKDGYRKFPKSKVRAGGFSGTLTAPTPLDIASTSPIISGFDVYEGDGGTAGIPVYTWYVSQPGTWLTATEKVGANKTITLSFSSSAETRFNGGAAFTTAPDPENVLRPLLRHVSVYVKDGSGNIQWVDLEKSAFTDV